VEHDKRLLAKASRLINLDCQEGSVVSRIIIDKKEEEIIIMPANQPHSLKAVKRFKMILTMMRS